MVARLAAMIKLSLLSGTLRVLCLGAHPDDIEIGCGGTLLSLADSYKVQANVVIATGSAERHGEARKAAQQFLPGAEVDVSVFGHAEGYLPDHYGEVKREFEELARSVTPDLIFAPRPDDAHQDHRTVAGLVPTVWRDSLVLRYEIPKWDGDLGRVTHYVPLATDMARRKVQLLDACFPSQRNRDWWDEETFLSLMRIRGMECRHRYAEGFIVEKAVIGVGLAP